MLIKQNGIYEIEIVSFTDKGEGIGKINDLAVFIDGAVVGDVIETKIIKLKKNYAIGEIVKIIKKSNYRIKPMCKHFVECGGCQIQNIKYEDQLKIKKQIVKDALERIGSQKNFILYDTLGMESPYYYRNKSSLPIDKDKKIGFYKKRSHNLVNIDECVIQGKLMNEIMNEIQKKVIELNISTYDEKNHKGLLRHIVIRESKSHGIVMIVFATNGKSFKDLDVLANDLVNKFPQIVSVYQNINKEKGNRILGYENRLFYGEAEIIDNINEYSFKISPNSFFQINNIQTEKLYRTALDYAELSGDEIVFDLYCGIGTITQFLAKKAKKVYGIEIVGDAIDDAIENTKLNNIDNVEYILGKAEKEIDQLIGSGINPDVIVVDPPRKGLDTKLIDKIIDVKPNRIVYVSCKPSTLARDIRLLTQNGYTLERVQPVDMFPHTMHVETIVKLQKKYT